MKKLNLLILLSFLVLSGCENKDDPIDLCPLDPYKIAPGACGCGNDDVLDVVTGQYVCADPKDLCPNDPNKTDPGICGCGTPDQDLDRNGLADCVDERIDLCPDDPKKKFPGACGCNAEDIISEDGKTVECREDKIDLCPDDPNKTKPGICGCGESDDIDIETGVPKCIFERIDLCPDDPDKKLPGACGCGVPDVDKNGNGILDCNEAEVDLCPYDPDKSQPGLCGCGMKEVEWDGTRPCEPSELNDRPDAVCRVTIQLCAPEDLDLCPEDANKTKPGICGCGLSDDDSDKDGIPDCIDDGNEDNDYCPLDDSKMLPGICGCGRDDSDLDELTGAPKCIADLLDLCPNDPNKMRPGICGCGLDDETDSDEDGTPDCIDLCPNDPDKSRTVGICGCGVPDTDENLSDFDADSVPNCLDACPENRWKSTDDGCECNAVKYDVQESDTSLCAQFISSAKEFISFRDQWNDGTLNSSSGPYVFLIVDDINLGDVLTQESSSSWIGIGTEEHPFDGILTGYRLNTENTSKVSISATGTSGHTTTKYVLGKEDSAYNALFRYTHAARISDLDIKLSFKGNDHVAGLVAKADETSISGIRYSEGSIEGKNYAAGLVAELLNSSVKNVRIENSGVSIQVESDFVGGLAASAENSQISSIAVQGRVSGINHVGGIVGQLKTSTLNNAYTVGSVTGSDIVGGIVGELTSRASVLNVATTSKVTCNGSLCASLIGSVSDFSTVKNAYSSGVMIDNNKARRPGTTPGYDAGSDEDDKNSEESDSEEISVPVAALIASFKSSDNVVDKLYYWELLKIPAMPEETSLMKFVTAPEVFSYVSLVPRLKNNNKTLLETLNGNLTCFGDNSCSLDGTSCIAWTDASRSISKPDSTTTMTVKIPFLGF